MNLKNSFKYCNGFKTYQITSISLYKSESFVSKNRFGFLESDTECTTDTESNYEPRSIAIKISASKNMKLPKNKDPPIEEITLQDINDDKYPIQSQKLNYNTEARSTRASNRGDLKIEASTLKSQATFLNDAFKIWNAAPSNIKNSKSLAIAKKEIRKFATTLPI